MLTSCLLSGALAFAACDDDGDKPIPTPERTGIEVVVTDFLTKVRDGDIDGYIAAWHPDGRPPEDRAEDAIGGSDLIGCDIDGSETSVRTEEFNTYVDVVFPSACGDGGITTTCEVYLQRRDGTWWIGSWACPLGSSKEEPND